MRPPPLSDSAPSTSPHTTRHAAPVFRSTGLKSRGPRARWESKPPNSMSPQILIDAIVRQTTVLIARLSTLEGTRSPLAHVANEVFVGLVRELESQGLGKKVIADMFGLALRSYRQKVQRLGESATSRGVTLWSAIHSYLASRETTTRTELLARFRYDDETSVRGILNDLVESGLVIRSGRGEETNYRVASAEELEDLGANPSENSKESLSALVWLHVYREGPITEQALSGLSSLSSSELEEALASLVTDGRIRSDDRDGTRTYSADECLIPVGQAAGWEAAVIDHYRAVLNALAAKIVSGNRTSTKGDEVGGTTLSFDLWPGHPHEAEVRGLLASTRSQTIPLWEKVTEYNKAHRAEGSYQVHFYCGQYLIEDELP